MKDRSVVAVGVVLAATAVCVLVSLVSGAVGYLVVAGLLAAATARYWRGSSPIAEELAVPDELAVAVEVLGDEPARLSLWHGLGLGDELHGWPVLLDGPYYTETGIECVLMTATGTSVEDWRSKVAELAAALAVPEVRCTVAGPGLVRVEARVVDTLAVPVPLSLPAERVDLARVTVGRTEDGLAWQIGVLYSHLLIVGVTGSGKGSVLWSVVAGLGPALRDGLARLHVVDPKGGVEFGAGTALFASFAPDAGEQALTVLRDLVQVMQDRAERLRRAGVRKHRPTISEPLHVLIVDEAASLAAYCPDRKARSEFEALLSLLLSQGRAVGVSVILACQDASKEVLSFRQLVPVRIALRLRESVAVPMVLGPGARDRGARCDEISDATPGVGYVDQDGRAEPVRVRAFEVTDSDIDALAQLYAPADGVRQTYPVTDEHRIVDLDEADSRVA